MSTINKERKTIFLLILFTLSAFTPGCKGKYDDLDLTMYRYRDTKKLVKFVYDAVLRVEKNGLDSLDYFRKNRDLFNTKDHYLYIYDMNGTNLYHAGMEHLEGKNLLDIMDKNGRKITLLTLNALEDENNPHAWVHYYWWKPGSFYPVPKSSCHFKVTTPDGKKLFIGGGLNYPQEETEFIRIIVDDAARLIEEKGQDALADISNPVSQFNYRDVRTFVFRPDGTILISPVIDDRLAQVKLLECSDEVGHKPFVKALEALEHKDSVWEVFMGKNRYRRKLTKKSLYLRKAVMAGENVFVGAITDLPQPPY